jgi:hypothetical protein
MLVSCCRLCDRGTGSPGATGSGRIRRGDGRVAMVLDGDRLLLICFLFSTTGPGSPSR